MINFKKSNLSQFNIIFPQGIDVQSVIVNSIIDYLIKFARENDHFQEMLFNRFLEDKKFGHRDYETAIHGKQFYTKDLFLRWLQIYRNFVNSVEFIDNYHKYLSPTYYALVSRIGKNVITVLRQSAEITYVYLFNIREEVQKERHAMQDLNDDQKSHCLFSGGKKQKIYNLRTAVSPVRFLRNQVLRSLVMKLLRVLQIGQASSNYLKNIQKQPLKKCWISVINVYLKSSASILMISYSISIGGVSSMSFIRKNLREGYRLTKKIAREWGKMPKHKVPKRPFFQIKERILTEKYQQLLRLCSNVMEMSESENDLVALLYPSPSEMGVYKLTKSDLAKPRKFNKKTGLYERIRPIEKINYVKEIIYSRGNLLDRRDLKDILGLDYDTILKESKIFRKKLKEEEGYNLNGIFGNFFQDFLGGTTSFILSMVRLFSALKKNKEAGQETNQEKNYEESKITRRPQLQAVAEKFDVPSRHTQLKEELIKVNAIWNQVMIDPKSFLSELE